MMTVNFLLGSECKLAREASLYIHTLYYFSLQTPPTLITQYPLSKVSTAKISSLIKYEKINIKQNQFHIILSYVGDRQYVTIHTFIVT